MTIYDFESGRQLTTRSILSPLLDSVLLSLTLTTVMCWLVGWRMVSLPTWAADFITLQGFPDTEHVAYLAGFVIFSLALYVLSIYPFHLAIKRGIIPPERRSRRILIFYRWWIVGFSGILAFLSAMFLLGMGQVRGGLDWGRRWPVW